MTGTRLRTYLQLHGRFSFACTWLKHARHSSVRQEFPRRLLTQNPESSAGSCQIVWRDPLATLCANFQHPCPKILMSLWISSRMLLIRPSYEFRLCNQSWEFLGGTFVQHRAAELPGSDIRILCSFSRSCFGFFLGFFGRRRRSWQVFYKKFCTEILWLFV